MKVIALPISPDMEEQLREIVEKAQNQGMVTEPLQELCSTIQKKANAAGPRGTLEAEIKGVLAYVEAVKQKFAAIDPGRNETVRTFMPGILWQMDNLLKSLQRAADAAENGY